MALSVGGPTLHVGGILKHKPFLSRAPSRDSFGGSFLPFKKMAVAGVLSGDGFSRLHGWFASQLPPHPHPPVSRLLAGYQCGVYIQWPGGWMAAPLPFPIQVPVSAGHLG